MAVSSIRESLADRLWFILRGDPLACVTRVGVHKDRLARTGARKRVRWLKPCNTLGFGLMSLRALAWGIERSLTAA